ncbi:MAG TPA: TonB-dependent receptor [Gemmatimonadaceae bacterium]|jgi:outer membrane receptor protein involved in Fe transport
MTDSMSVFSSLSRRACRAFLVAAGVLVASVAAGWRPAQAQDVGPTGTIAGRIVDETGAPIEGVQVYIVEVGRDARSGGNGIYRMARVPVGTRIVHARLVGYRMQSATVTVVANGTTTQDFRMPRDPLNLSTVVVTGTVAPRSNLESSVPITTLTPAIIEQAQPRSTTEMLRYVPGFTRVESSGGEVNENISMRGILGVEYVMFMEDGLPVFPTMHTFFMNADNLFRPDENLAQMEVIRGSSSSLFGSNTPGAVINFLNKTGGSDLATTMRLTAGTQGLGRVDFNTNGPLTDLWRFNLGGFYRYDHGVRDPGFPGVRGGQIKGNVTRLLPNGFLRFSAKVIDDRNQFILDLPFTNASDPHFVSGFGDYGSMNTNQGLDLRVPTPEGSISLPLGDGLRTSASWYTADAQLQLAGGFVLENAAQIMHNDQGWNAIVPFNAFDAAAYITAPTNVGGLGYPAGTTYQYVYTNVLDASGAHVAYSTPNNLVAPGGEWHVEKPLTAFQNQLQLRKNFGENTVSAGLYFANYTQTNKWYFTDVLTDVQDNPNFLDLVVTPPGGTPINVTKNGFRHYISNYVNGSGQSTIVSGVLGGDFVITPRLRASLGGRLEWNNFVQSAENTSNVDLDGNANTQYDNETWGNGSFRHFDRSLHDWAASLGLNYSLTPNLAIYASAARGYKMPALDEYLNATAEAQVALFDSRHVQSTEAGVKYASGSLGLTLNGFYTLLKNIVSQGAVVGSDGRTTWIIVTSPENKSYGVEMEAVVSPITELELRANGTWLRAELGSGAGADIGSRINGVPASIGNLSAAYRIADVRLIGDWHYVAKRFVDVTAGVTLPSYNYFNFGAGYTIPGSGTTLDLNVLNAFQSHGLEEGNPRIVAGAATSVFLARPLLPRRIQASVTYAF